MTDMWDTVGAGTAIGTSSAFTGDSGDVAIGFQRTIASATILDHDRAADVREGGVASGLGGNVIAFWPEKIR
jgi:hypothetical protein